MRIRFRLVLSLAVTSAAVATNSAGENLAPLGESPDWDRLKDYSASMTSAELQQALDGIYTDGRAHLPIMKVGPTRLEVVVSGADSDSTDPETLSIPLRDPLDRTTVTPPRYWRTAAELPPLDGRPPLSDLRIAIDPGHIGGKYARMEARWFQIDDQPPVLEGEIVLEVAQLLRERLESLGAEVTLTRETNAPVTAERPDDFRTEARRLLIAQGIANPPANYKPGQDGREQTIQFVAERLFYRAAEIRERARLVNEVIRPDLTLCLHLNAEPWGDPADPTLTKVNHLHVLVNGAYSFRELLQDDVRFEMLLRIFQRIHEAEVPLADRIATALARTTGLPAYRYTTPNAQPVNENNYLWARNLLANRLFMNPVVFLEPFVMNNEEVHTRLQAGFYQGRTLIHDRLQPSLHHEYVDGVVKGLVRHYRLGRPRPGTEGTPGAAGDIGDRLPLVPDLETPPGDRTPPTP